MCQEDTEGEIKREQTQEQRTEKDSMYELSAKNDRLKSDFRRALSTDETIKTELCEDMSEIPGGNIFDAEYREPGRDTG